jgi:hypothetical protein
MNLYAAAAEAPSWTDKLEAWSTFGAAIFTATAVVVAFLVWRHDQRVRREDELASDAAQARLVVNKIVSIAGSREAGWLGVSYEIHNNSASRITEAQAVLFMSDGSDPTITGDVGELEPDQRHEEQVLFDEPLPWRFAISSFSRRPSWKGRVVLGVDMQVQFVDAHGSRWYRVNDQEPRKAMPRIYVSSWRLLGDYLHVTTVFYSIRDLPGRAALRLRGFLQRRLRRRRVKRSRPAPGVQSE